MAMNISNFTTCLWGNICHPVTLATSMQIMVVTALQATTGEPALVQCSKRGAPGFVASLTQTYLE